GSCRSSGGRGNHWPATGCARSFSSCAKRTPVTSRRSPAWRAVVSEYRAATKSNPACGTWSFAAQIRLEYQDPFPIPWNEPAMTTNADLLTRALRHHQAGEWARARELYCQVLGRDPHQADAWHLLGVLAHQAAAHGL